MDINNSTVSFSVNVVDLWDGLSMNEKYALMERELKKICPLEPGQKESYKVEFAKKCLEVLGHDYKKK